MLTLANSIAYGANDGQSPLRVSGDHNYPPYEFLENGQPAGFNIDLLRAVAEVMGIEIEISLGPWNEVRKALETGKIDALSGMYYSRERERSVDFSAPYIIVNHAIFVRGESFIRTADDIRGKEIIVPKDDIMHDYARANNLSPTLITVGNPLDAIRLLASGRHDCALLPKLQGLYLAGRFKLDNIKTVGPPIYPREYCFAVAKGNTELVATLNEGLNILKATGRYKTIHDKWFAVHERNKTAQLMLKYALLILIAIATLLIVVAAWTWSLKRQVSRQTSELRKELGIRKQAEEALKKSEKRLSQIIEGNSIATFVIDQDHNVTHWNRACENLTGISARKMISAQKLWKAFYFAERPIMADLIVNNASEKEIALYYKGKYRASSIIEGAYEAEDFFRDFGESGKWLFFTAAPLKDAEGKITGAIETLQDITERKLAEEALRKARDELEIRVEERTAELTQTNEELKRAKEAAEAATRAKSEFLANVSHEIRTPMSGVITATELALNEKLPGKVERYMKIIHASARSLLEIINDILDFSKIETAKLELETQPFELNTVIKNVVDLFADKAAGKQIRLSLNIDPETPNALIGDSLRLQQILRNLIDNAIKFTEKSGSILVNVTGAKLSSNRSELTFCVTDTGIGIAPEHLAMLFNPFTQVDASSTRKYGGTGLGLAICKQLVEMMNGHIRAESEPGKGSRFYFTASFGLQEVTRRPSREIQAHVNDSKSTIQETESTTSKVKAAEKPPAIDSGEPEKASDTGLDTAQLIPLLQKLATALEIADPEGIRRHMESLAKYLDQSSLRHLENRINDYDYDEALESLKRIIDNTARKNLMRL